jgi:hypothetical protein
MIAIHPCRESVREPTVSVRGLYAATVMINFMDIVAVAMAVTTFAILFALIYAIDRI